MSDVLYICIECELAGREANPTPLTSHSLCRVCGSSSVVPVDSLVELAAKQKRESEAPPSPTDANTRLRVQAMRDQRKRDSEPLRTFLRSVVSTTRIHPTVWERDVIIALDAALAAWDGWSWHVYYPWCTQPIEDNPAPGHFTIELVSGAKNGPRWVITLDSSVATVRSFQDGTV